MTCPWCGRRPLIRQNEYISTTCGNSACQQAAYLANVAANRRPPRRKVRR